MLSIVETGGDVLPYIVLATATGGVLSVIVASVAAIVLRPQWISAIIGAALLASLVPGYRAYKASLADGLSPRL